jgi:hypothetical protein
MSHNPAAKDWEQGMPVKDGRFYIAFFSKGGPPFSVQWRDGAWRTREGACWRREPLCFSTILDPVNGKPVYFSE